MMYLSTAARRWPILRISVGVILAFTLTMLLAWLISGLVVG